MLRASRAVSSGGLLFAGTFAGSLLGYVFFVILGRTLPPDQLGAVGSLVNLSTILTVPGLGLQLVTARWVSVRRGAGVSRRDLLVAGALVGGVPGVVLALASPWVAPALHLSGPAPVVALAAAAVPMALVYAGLGVLQGVEAFAAVGLAGLLVGVAKIVAAMLAAFVDGGVLGVVLCYAAGWAVIAVIVIAVAARHLRADVGAHAGVRLAREGVVGALPTAALLVLSSLDLILARHHLSGQASGVYTIGALFEKVAFWGPQFLATLYYPRMARPAERAAALRTALLLTGGVGVVGVLIAFVAGDLLVRIVGGPTYVAELGPLAWVFTALGVGLALVQVLVYADLAVGGHRVGVAVWVTVVVASAAIFSWHGSVSNVATTMLICVLVVVPLALALTWNARGRQTAHPEDMGVPPA